MARVLNWRVVLPYLAFGNLESVVVGLYDSRDWPGFQQNGMPPTAVNKNIMIMIHVRHFSPKCEIVELPSLWTIRRARLMLLVVVQTLSAYRLGVAKKWGQLFTDGTSLRQKSFNLLTAWPGSGSDSHPWLHSTSSRCSFHCHRAKPNHPEDLSAVARAAFAFRSFPLFRFRDGIAVQLCETIVEEMLCRSRGGSG